MLRKRLNDALKDAMKAREEEAVATLRLILAALKDRYIADRAKGNTEGIDEDEILGLLQSMIKQRHDSIDAYTKGGRQDLADREALEITIIERFLPEQLDDEETATAIAESIEACGATGLKQMGQVMGMLRERYPGRLDFGKASARVKERLG